MFKVLYIKTQHVNSGLYPSQRKLNKTVTQKPLTTFILIAIINVLVILSYTSLNIQNMFSFSALS